MNAHTFRATTRVEQCKLLCDGTRTAEEVAAELGMTVRALYTMRSRYGVKSRFRQLAVKHIVTVSLDRDNRKWLEAQCRADMVELSALINAIITDARLEGEE
jgi:hypothetical protein